VISNKYLENILFVNAFDVGDLDFYLILFEVFDHVQVVLFNFFLFEAWKADELVLRPSFHVSDVFLASGKGLFTVL
jgi:hypothetical protein